MMNEWLDRLRAQNEISTPELPAKGDKREDEGLLPPFAGRLPGEYQKKKTTGGHPIPDATGQLEQAIRRASSWADLEAVLDEAQEFFERGELSIEQVERLAVLAAQEAKVIPEAADPRRRADNTSSDKS